MTTVKDRCIAVMAQLRLGLYDGAMHGVICPICNDGRRVWAAISTCPHLPTTIRNEASG